MAEVRIVPATGPDGGLSPGLACLLRDWAPHVVGFRLEAGHSQPLRRIIAQLRALARQGEHPRPEILVGGPTATVHAAAVLDDLGADYVFAGEADQTLCAFFSHAARPNSRDRAADIPGLAYRYGGVAHVNLPSTDGYGRSGLPHAFPQCSLPLLRSNLPDYRQMRGFDQKPFDAIYLTAGRGCPGHCTFCGQLHGSQVRTRTAEQILDDIASADHAARLGRFQLERWPHYQATPAVALQSRHVAWAAVYDEDFLLDRARSIEFFARWESSPLRAEYRLMFQTNPRSLLDAQGRLDRELIGGIARTASMVQLGGESFHSDLLARWRKRHDASQLETVLAALDATGLDYTVFHLHTDLMSTPLEVLDAAWLLARGALRHRRMRIASSPFTIPLYQSDARRRWEFAEAGRGADHYGEYEVPQPGWMDPVAAHLARLADEHLHWAIHAAHRDDAVVGAVRAMADWLARSTDSGTCTAREAARMRELASVATWQWHDLVGRRLGRDAWSGTPRPRAGEGPSP